MKWRLTFLLVVPVLAGALHPAGAAAGTDGTSRTYLRGWESTDDKTHVPLYEYLDLDSTLGEGSPFSLHAGAWGRVDLGEDTYGESARGELQYGYVAYTSGTGNRFARLGRVEASGGVARGDRLDGLALGGDLAAGFATSAYVGVPLETDNGGRGGDLLYGGRIAHKVLGFSEVGVSYLKERNDDEDAREEEGVDIFLRPHRMIMLDGSSIYSPDDSSWMEHQYRAVLTPLPALTLTGEFQDVDYASFFRSADVTAFDRARLADETGMRLYGASAAYAITPAVTATVSWRGYTYDVAGDAHTAGGRLGYRAGAFGAELAYTRVSGEVPRLRYDEYRGYALWRPGPVEFALDVGVQRYDEEIDGRDNGTTASLAAGYTIRPNLRIVADGTYIVDPIYSEDVRGTLKLVYAFSLTRPKPGGAAK